LRKLISIVFFILLCKLVTAQVNIDSFTTDVSLFKNAGPLNSNSLLFIDSNNIANADNILQQQHWAAYKTFSLNNYTIPAYWVNKKVFIKFTLQNSSPLNDTVYFYPGLTFRSITVYKIINLNNLQLIKDESQDDGFQPLTLLANEKTTYLAELHFTKKRVGTLYPQLVQQVYLTDFKKIFYSQTYSQLVGYMLSGLLLMMVLFNGANFQQNKKKEFFYNCCYALCMFCLVFLNTFLIRKGGVFASFFMGYLSFVFLVIGIVFYIVFTQNFLDTKANYPTLHAVLFYEVNLLLVLLAFFSFIYFFTNFFWLKILLENSIKIILLVMGVVYIVLAIRQKNQLINYLAIGNSIMIFFSSISFVLLLYPFKTEGIFTTSILYFEIGIVFELIFFLLGLSYKNKVELINKIKEQEAMKLAAEKQIFESKIAILNAQQDERNRISADMHDDLGAGVTAIRLFSELAKSRLGKNTIPEIEKISSSANELLNNMNAIIWTMNSSNDSFGNMVAYIRNYALEYFENTGIKCTVEIEKVLPQIAVNGELRRNVFLVVKEALNNVLKHSKATEVSLVLKTQDTSISLFIQDNGTGIDLDNLRRFGNGLKNMKQRMAKAGVNFSIESNNGTLVTLHHTLLAD